MNAPGELTRAREPFDVYPFIVAEMGANHMGDFNRALKILEAAQRAGADAVKLQTFQPDTMLAAGAQHRIVGGLWDGQDLWNLYVKCALPWSWHERLFERGRDLGVMVFSTPFDKGAVDFLERLGCPMYKIASFEILDVDLIKHAAQTGKSMVISTGMASLDEIEDAVVAAFDGGCSADGLTLLKCTSAYPAPAAEANLAAMANLRKRFGCKVGLSDHTRGVGVAVAAAVEGADMIEKHMGDYRNLSPDESFSVDPLGMETLVNSVHDAMDAIGTEHFGPSESEAPMLALRRSLRVVRAMTEGQLITEQDIAPLRPAGGMRPKDKHKILGMRVIRDVQAGEPVTWDLVRSEPRA